MVVAVFSLKLTFVMYFPMNCFGRKSDLHECMLKIMTQNMPGNDNSCLLSLNHRKCVIVHVAKKHLARVASTLATLAQSIPIHPPTAKWQKKGHKNTFHHHTPITPDTQHLKEIQWLIIIVANLFNITRECVFKVPEPLYLTWKATRKLSFAR